MSPIWSNFRTFCTTFSATVSCWRFSMMWKRVYKPDTRFSTTCTQAYVITELSVGPISSTQPNPPNDWPNPTNPSQSKNFGPTNQPNTQPNRTPYNQQQTFGHKKDNFNISQSVKVYQVGLLLIYQYLSLSGYHVLFSSHKRPTKV